MACQRSNDSGACGRGPAPLRKFATAVFAVACIVGTAAAWTWDAAPVRIAAPTGNVDSGEVVTPSAVVINLGDSIASFPVLFSIGTTYADTQDVVGLNPGDSVAVSFLDWTAVQRGLTTVACSTALSTDESTANDRVVDTFTVRVRDVGVDQIVAPVGIVDSGLVITPQAKVTNYGTNNINSFWAVFRIGASYLDSLRVRNLAPGASRVVDFAGWAADTLGTFAVSCTAAYNNDVYPENNLAQDSCVVQVIPADAGVMRILGPGGIVDSGAVLSPQAMVRNYGSNVSSFPVIFRVGSYVDTQQVTDLGPLDSLLVTFADWTAGPLGMLTTRCSTALVGDSIPANDARSDSVEVIVRMTDAGVASILAPADTVDSGTVFAPQALVRNFGLAAVSFPVRFVIGMAYADTQQVTDLAAGDSLVVKFADYTVAWRTPTTARCSTMLTGDQDPGNDRVLKAVFRRVRDVGVAQIVGPAGTVDSGTVVSVQAMVRNYGNVASSFTAVFTIGTAYADTEQVSDLGPLDSLLVTFGDWTASPLGTFPTRCSTAMDGDMVSANDILSGSVQVASVGVSESDPALGIPRTVTLSGNGPFAGRVSIVYGLPRSAELRLEVYDACGRLVRVVADGVGKPGYHTADWCCTDERGRAVPQGAYFVRLTADGTTLTSKIVKTE